MTFSPAIPLGGVGGLRFLERTGDAQRALHARSPELQRNIAYFAENIARIGSAEELVKDRQLLTVALGAYGLGDEIDKRAFVQRILEEGTASSDALANRMNDQRYRKMTEAFRFDRGEGLTRTGSPALRDEIISRYLEQSFEIAVGEQDQSLRLALNFKRNAAETGERGWFAILGDKPIREVFQTALGLPKEIAAIDIDKQKELFEERAAKFLGTRDLSVLEDPAVIDKIVSRYLIIDQASSGPAVTTPGYSALTLLANSGFGPSASRSLFQSSF